MGFPYSFPFKFKEFTRILKVRTEIKGHHNINIKRNANHKMMPNLSNNHQISPKTFANHLINMSMQSNHLIQNTFVGGDE